MSTPAITFDPTRLVYVSNGTVLPRSVIKQASEAVVAESRYRIQQDALVFAQAVQRAGAMEQSTFDIWFASFQQQVKLAHLAQAALARGGFEQLQPADIERVENLVAEHVNTFGLSLARDVSQGRYGTKVESGQFLQRVALYADAGRATYENERLSLARETGHEEARRILAASSHCDECEQLAEMGWMPIEEMVEIGDATCKTGCRCIIITRRVGEAEETL